MRPVRLEAEGFTCYRERQVPLDFTGLSLFAIAGPTGAGKSSILDTMLYALYGEVPRIGKQGIGEFIAHGRDAMSVALDFAVRGSTYRVVRRVKRGKKGLTTQATLAELVAGSERSIADGVKPVNEAIERLLGLDFSSFTQTVILPQGDFDRFLKAAPTEQRAILQHLLRHEVFERMRMEAERRRGEAERDTQGLERQLTAFEQATPEALALLHAELVAASATLAELAERKASGETALQQQRALHHLTMEVRRLRERKHELDDEAPRVVAASDELDAARRAAQIVPRMDACAAADTRLTLAVQDLTEANRVSASVDEALAAAESRLVSAMADAAPCPDLALRIRALDEIKGDLLRRDALRQELAGYERRVPDASTRRAAADTSARAAGELLTAAEQRRALARSALAESGFDSAEQQRLDDLWTVVVQARAADTELARLAHENQALDVECQRADRAFAAQDKAFAAAARDAAAAARADEAAGDALEQGRTRHQAAAVRAHLHTGEACPVCLQTVVLMPPSQSPPELDALIAAADQARKQVGAAQKALQAAGEKRAAARASADGARTALDSSASVRAQKQEARALLHHRIVQALAGTIAGLAAADVLAVVEARRTSLREARSAHERAADDVRAAEAAVSHAQVAGVRAEAELQAATDDERRLKQDAASRRTELDSLVACISAVSTHPDPASERSELAARVTALESAVASAQGTLAKVRTEAASAAARHSAAQIAVANAEAAAASERRTLDAALQEAGFGDVGGVRTAVRTPQQQTALNDTVRRHESDVMAVTSRLREIEPGIAGREVSADVLAAAEAENAGTVEAWHQAGLAVSTLEAACKRLQTEVARRAALEQELAGLRSRLALNAGMASDLRGDAFQEYLLEEAFHSLVAGASVRMRQMSNRYTLEWKDSDFFVIDHDNAAERRRAETLSGGETFMASLCLALQLSDEVLKTSGALQMDSLFIDEGFGTLDAESLAEVTDAMEALRQDGARLIGVISHRPELTERLPGCIKVMKGAGESTWLLERAG